MLFTCGLELACISKVSAYYGFLNIIRYYPIAGALFVLLYIWKKRSFIKYKIQEKFPQFDKVKRIVEILSKPNAKVALEKLQTTCDTVTKIMKDLEKMLLLPPLGRENASDGIDVVCNRLQSRVAAVAEALSKIKPLGSTRLDLRSKSFRVLRINKAVSDQSLLESHFCNKKSLKAESVVLDAEASEAVVSFFSRKDAEYAFVRGAQVRFLSRACAFSTFHRHAVERPSPGIRMVPAGFCFCCRSRWLE